MIQPDAWSSLAVRWRAASSEEPGRMTMQVGGAPALHARCDAAVLCPCGGPLLLGDPHRRGVRGEFRDVRIGDGSPLPIGEWPLDDGPGPWARDRTAAGQHGLALHG